MFIKRQRGDWRILLIQALLEAGGAHPEADGAHLEADGAHLEAGGAHLETEGTQRGHPSLPSTPWQAHHGRNLKHKVMAHFLVSERNTGWWSGECVYPHDLTDSSARKTASKPGRRGFQFPK